MSDFFKILAIGLMLAATVPAPQAQAAGSNRLLQRAQNPPKPETCKPKWPYVTMICVA